MSFFARALLNANALEHERKLRAAEALAEQSVYSRIEDFEIEATPTIANKIEATNLVTDPQGLGAGSVWNSLYGTRGRQDGGVPSRWLRAVTNVADGTNSFRLFAAFTAPVAATYYFYILAKSDADITFTSCFRPTISTGTTAGVTAAQRIDGWTLLKGSADLAAGNYGILVVADAVPAAGRILLATGATVCQGVDPLEPFAGDFETTDKHLYTWRAGRNASSSLRIGRFRDMIALREEEAGLDVNPVGQTVAMRREYLAIRRRARHHPYAQTFVDLITQLVKQDNPGFTSSGVRVVEDFAAQSFRVEIAYAASGVLADRVMRMINEIQPAHLARTSITWGAFQAGTASGEAGDPV